MRDGGVGGAQRWQVLPSLLMIYSAWSLGEASGMILPRKPSRT
jgi:hypothetical protein